MADTRLFTLPGRSVGRSVTFLKYCSCPTVRDWSAVYPALFFVIFVRFFFRFFFPQNQYLCCIYVVVSTFHKTPTTHLLGESDLKEFGKYWLEGGEAPAGRRRVSADEAPVSTLDRRSAVKDDNEFRSAQSKAAPSNDIIEPPFVKIENKCWILETRLIYMPLPLPAQKLAAL